MNISFAIHFYFIVAILYNVASQLCLDIFKKKFAPTEPISGVLIISVFYLLYLMEELLPFSVRIFLMVIYLLAVIRFGIFYHLLNFTKDAYFSRQTWILAIIINIFGVLVLLYYLLLLAI